VKVHFQRPKKKTQLKVKNDEKKELQTKVNNSIQVEELKETSMEFNAFQMMNHTHD